MPNPEYNGCAILDAVENYKLTTRENFQSGTFRAMASPCEVIVDSPVPEIAQTATLIAQTEALRIEKTFSRYRNDNIVHKINQSNGRRIKVDDETAGLLDFANQCYVLSEGLFDITSGVLRRAWTFDGSDKLPTQQEIDPLLALVGWNNVKWEKPYISLPKGMQIDFGGIGKEYAVDRTVSLIRQAIKPQFLVNFGGDLHASGTPTNGYPWHVGIEHMQEDGKAVSSIKLSRGALTTSGDAHRYLLKEGVRYGHVLHPKTGWPTPNAPHAVSVLSDSCTEAGILSTLAMLKGSGAEEFLDEQEARYWCHRSILDQINKTTGIFIEQLSLRAISCTVI